MPKIEKPRTGVYRPAIFLSFLFLILTVLTPEVKAQDKAEMLDPYPLRRADTSSPRATLKSFLTDAPEVIEAWRGGAMTPASIRAFDRAVNTLDFSATSDGNSYNVRVRRFLLLKELLDRIDLPPDDAIPGANEVAEGTIAKWTIPNTPITIQRTAEGPRAGQYLFSARTVEQLDRLYEIAKFLPYKPGATAGSYEAYISSDQTKFARQSEIQNRLNPVDTSTPRSTIFGLLESVNRAYALVMDAEAALRATPPAITLDEARKIESEANNLLQRAVLTLDLSLVPKALHQDVGVETVLQLKETFDRMQLPPIETIPNLDTVTAARRGVGGAFSQTNGPLRWRYPGTDIEIVEIAEGDRRGEFLFSGSTVENMSDIYQKISDLPYRKEDKNLQILGYKNTTLTKGFYEYYISTPGYLIASASFLGRFVNDLPPIFKTLYLEQAIWQWAGLALGVLSVVFAAILLFSVFRRLAAGRRPPWNTWFMILPPALIALISFPVASFIDKDLNVTGQVLAYVIAGNRLIVIAMTALATFTLCKAIAESVIASPHIKEGTVDATIWRICSKIAGLLLAAWILIAGIEDLGVNVFPILAGLGVGGLAVALAARETLSDLLGSFIILADRPFRVGHWVIVDGKEGTVESIGVRSTRIRTFYDSAVSIPNSRVSSQVIDNMGMRKYRRVYSKLGIRYDTPPERVEAFLEGIKRIIQANPHTRKDYMHVTFNDFGPDSLTIMIYFFLKVPTWADELMDRQRVFLEIIRLADALDVHFAFPTQTLEIESFPGRPGRENASPVADEELRLIAEDFGDKGKSARPRGLGIFVPQHEEAPPSPPQSTVATKRKRSAKIRS